jgi:hypothetical protein
MISATMIHKLRMGAIALAGGLALCAASLVQAHGGGGGGGGGHGGGGYGGGGGHGGGGHGGYGGRGGRGGRGGYGYGRYGYGGYGYGRFGYGGFGYGGFGYYGGFGLLGYGLFFDTLPLYYSTLWWGGSPYYYANDNYYQWNGAVSQYETVRPPRELASQVATTQTPENFNLFAYPKNGQTAEQQATDRMECQQWATGQTATVAATPADTQHGSGAGVAAASPGNAASPIRQQDYLRAQSACLAGRGYSVQ